LGPDVTAAGIAAFALDDGELLWETPFDLPVDGESRAHPIVYDITAGGSTVVAAVDDQMGGPPDLYAYDATDGSLRWKAGGLLPSAVTGDVVLVRPDVLDETHEWSLAALDAETGGQRWSLGEDDTSWILHQAAGDVAVVAGFDSDSGGRTAAVDIGTGEELADFGPGVGACATDGATLVACAVDGPERGTQRVATFGIEDGTTGVSGEALPPDTTVVGVVGGRIIVGAEDEDARSVDRSGTIVDAALPGPFHSTNQSYAVFGCEPHPSVVCSDYSVHQLD
jgi:outer membrane protein assembly factor BamB